MAIFGAGWGISQNATLALILARDAPYRYGVASALWYAVYDASLDPGAFGFGVVAAGTGYPAAYALTVALVLAAILPARSRDGPQAVNGRTDPRRLRHWIPPP